MLKSGQFLIATLVMSVLGDLCAGEGLQALSYSILSR